MRTFLLKKTRWKILFISIFFSLNCALSFAQQSTKITGVVYDETQMPMIGVTVSVKGTTTGSITDVDGRFELLSPEANPTLSFTYLGYITKEIKADGRQDLVINMTPDTQTIDEVVVVGYGTQKKLSVTGAVGTVSAKDLERTTATTTAATLAGKVAGITFRQTNGQPGQTMRMEIRNMGTPLYIIDGVMKDEGQFNNLDINDIDNISILKDGSAAIYGVKAANGVVLVTTKRGKLNEKPTVNVNAYYGWQNWTRFPKTSDAYGYTKAWSEADINTSGVNSKNLTYEELDKWKTGYYNPETGEDYRSFDWYDFVVNKNAPQKYINASSTGGSEKINYYISISRMDQEASFHDFNFNRTNFQANLDAKISKYLKVGTSMNGRLEKRESPTISMTTYQEEQEDGSFKTRLTPGNYNDDFWRMRWGLNQNRPTEHPYANDNPDYINKIFNNYTNQAYGRRDIAGVADDLWRVFQGNWDIEWTTPIKGLKADFMYSYYVANQQEDRRKNEVSFYSYDYQNDVYKHEDTDVIGPSAISKRQRTIWENMYRFSINYNNKFEDHSLSAVFVAEATERFDRTLLMYNFALTDNYQELLPKDNQDNQLEDYYAEAPTAGYIGRINYAYRDKYLLELSGRYDGSFKFPEDKRWGFFPSISGGWRISEEDFFKNNGINNWMTNLKLRASYGELGDDSNANAGDVLWGYGNFDYLSSYTYGTGTVISPDPFARTGATTVKGIYQGNLPITNVSWIKSSITDIGLDFGFLKNRLTVEIDGFYRKRTGLVATRSSLTMPYELGYTMPPENLNSDMHMGVDGFVKWQDHIGDFSYYAGVNATFARKKDGESWGQSFSSSWDEYRTSTLNRWSYVNWGYEVIGRFNTQEEADTYPVIMNLSNGSDRNMHLLPGDLIYKDQNGDGVIDDLDSRPIGYAEGGLPYLTYGINLGGAWKSFDLAMDFAGASFQSFQQNWETKWPFQASGNTFEFMVNDRWHHADPLDASSPWVAGSYPALRLQPTDAWHNYCNNSTYWMKNLTYLRLRNLELGYTLPSLLTNKLSIQKLRFYFSGTNLFCFDNISYLGLDPENTDTNGLGYPQNRVLTIGVNVTF